MGKINDVRDRDQILDKVKGIAADILLIPSESIHSNQSFVELGMSSVLSVDFIEKINEVLLIQLGVEAVYDYQNIEQFADHIVEMIAAQSPSTSLIGDSDKGNRKRKRKKMDTQPVAIESQIIGILAEILEMPADVLNTSQSLVELGLSSMRAVEFIESLNERLGTKLGVEVVYDYHLVSDLIVHIAEKTLPGAEPAEEGSHSRSSGVVEERDSDIAIIGISGKYAGSETIGQFWEHLQAGDCCIGKITRKDWVEDHYYTPDPAQKNKSVSKWGGLLNQIDQFDAAFFHISRQEAERMDPQQRLFMEEAYKAIEDSGYLVEKLAGSKMGVFVGGRSSGYKGSRLAGENNSQTFLGNEMSILASRISYYFNWKGPSFAVDTACSSSLTAIHLACESIRRGESEMALAGGVFVMSTPEFMVLSSQSGMLSPEGVCHTFDTRANGMVLGEGVGIVVLKKLRAAVEDKDHIYGVIKGSAMNQSGRTNGMAAPSMLSQKELLIEAYQNAGISPETVSYIEVHGTGTKLGDSIEVKALTEAFQTFTDKTAYCAIGSHKPNFGHATFSAGIAGVFKVLMAMKHEKIPPMISIKQLNEHIQLKESPFYVNEKLMDWIGLEGTPLRAGVTSLGSNGTNCHMVLEQFVRQPNRVNPPSHPLYLLLLSAKTKPALRRKQLEMIQWLDKAGSEYSLPDIAYTLTAGRIHHPVRCAVIAESLQDYREKLMELYEQVVESDESDNEENDSLHIDSAEPDFHAQLMKQLANLNAAAAASFSLSLSQLAEFYVRGGQVEWEMLYSQEMHYRVPLPTYPFEGERYWLDGKSAANVDRPEVQPEPETKEVSAEGGLRVAGMDGLLASLLAKQLHSIGSFEEQVFSLSMLKEQAGISDAYERWLEAGLALLVEHHYLGREGAHYRVKTARMKSMELAWEAWDVQKKAWLANPATQAQTVLVETMLRALPDIVTGRRPSTDIMFPESSMRLVEGIYKNNAVADYFNETLADTLATYIEGKLQQNPTALFRFIEVGAGTGGTSSVLFEKLQAYRDHIQEYCYTDISKAFLMYAEAEYGSQYTYVSFKKWDVNSPIEGQNIEAGVYDAVIAANVLHAVPNVRDALRHVKGALKKEGLLLLNEISGNSLFLHLTFGLLDGWWLHEDRELRISGSPALTPISWEQVLDAEGYQRIVFPREDVHELGQQIIAAESDGILRTVSVVDSRQERVSIAPAKSAQNLSRVQSDQAKESIKKIILTKLASSLNIAQDWIDTETSFRDFGVDSIIGVNLVNVINEELAIDMETTILFDYSSVNQLTAYILSEYGDRLTRLSQLEEPVSDSGALEAGVMPDKNQSASQPTGDENNGEDTAAPFKEPIAIVGMSGRFAQSETVDELWEHLAQGTHLIEEVKRWDLSRYYPDASAYCNHGGFLKNVEEFDPQFFNISGLEATYMDPQQRIFLEEAWKALEDAGYAGTGVSEARCGIYVGCDKGDYQQLIDRADAPPQAFWGNLGSLIPARIAYHLNLQGPAIAVDTACSSSLVSIHLACQGLWTKETDMALAGGIFIQATDGFYVSANRAEMLSNSGRCFTFDDRADGMVPSEAVGIVMLKRLQDAVADGDHIYGVIRGSGINQDGTTNGITAPSLRSQERLEREVYDTFDIDPAQIQMVEAHGTGTKLGDPIEYQALSRAFRHYTADERYCAIGSLKTNIGHAQIAAGVTGLIKILLSLKNRQIPPSLHFEYSNTNISFSGSPFYVNTELKDWSVGAGGKRLAALSSFGASGTNAHMVIEGAPQIERRHGEKPGYLIVLSAQSQGQLRQQAEQLAAYGKQQPGMDCGNISYTLLLGRKHFKHRLACTTQTTEELVDLLHGWLQGKKPPQVIVSEVQESERREQASLKRYGDACIRSCREIGQVGQYMEQLLGIADLYSMGYDLEYGELFADGGYSRIPLPKYPFARERYWVPERSAGATIEVNMQTVQNVPAWTDRGRSEEQEETALLTFEERWQERALPVAAVEQTQEGQRQTLVLFLSAPERQQEVRHVLRQLNPASRVIFISRGPSFSQLSSTHYSVEPHQSDAYQAAWQAIGAEHGEIDAALYLWPLEEAEFSRDYTSLLLLLQGAAAASFPPRRLLLAGRYEDGQERSYLEAWMGLERSLGMAMPDVQTTCIYGEESTREEPDLSVWTQRLCAELQAPKAQSARYEAGRRYVCEVVPKPMPERGTSGPFRLGGTYVITGGLGGLGRLFAEQLLKRQPVNLVLIGRSGEDAEKHAQIQALEAAGGRVMYVQADVSDRASMERGLRQARDRFGPLHGVIHAAGLLSNQTLLRQTAAEFSRILAPKIQGTLVLDEVLKEDALDFVCYFSSSSAILGDFGSCNYAMGNRFLMGYADYRNELARQGRRQGTTIAIQWPLWREGSMATRDSEQTKMYLQASGQRFLEGAEGFSVFERLLSGGSAPTLVLAGQPTRIQRFLGLSGIEKETKPASPLLAPASAAASRSSGKGRRPEMRGWSIEQCLEWELKELVSQLLKIPRERVDRTSNLSDFGFDSLSLAQFAKELTSFLGIQTTPSVFYGYPTVGGLVHYFLGNHERAIQAHYQEDSEPMSVLKVAAGEAELKPQSSSAAKDAPRAVPREVNAEAAPAPSGEEIAIIGMSGRFPDARNMEEFWSILASGSHVVTEYPYGRLSGRKGRLTSVKGGWVPGVEEFDPAFFEISPREAESMDPRQRLLLQESWRALEDAGYGSQQIERNKIGIFVGVEQGDYQLLDKEAGTITSNHNAILSARLAYFLNLTGPVLSIDTACSSGLVAVHQACASLRSEECDTALAAGVSLILAEETIAGMQQAGMLSEDGTCYAFDKRASGMVPSEAVAVVVLKRLSQAVADGDPIYAVIKGSGINYNGKANGITAPNGVAQTLLLNEIYDKYNVDADRIDYIVAHGTGTRLGDPVEINALNDAFKNRTSRQGYCALTSVKSNIGHTLAASGIVNLISLVQALRQEVIPPSLHCETENEYIEWNESPFYVNKVPRPWPKKQGQTRIGAMSSFGMSGTNAHLVVESYEENSLHPSKGGLPYVLLTFTAKTESALQEKLEDMITFLQKGETEQTDLLDISYTLLQGRHHFQYRCTVVVQDKNDAIHVLNQAVRKEKSPAWFAGMVPRDFTGQQTIEWFVQDLVRQSRTLRSHQMKYGEMLKAAAEFYCQGYDIDWEPLFDNTAAARIHLPAYPFARETYWIRTVAKSPIHPLPVLGDEHKEWTPLPTDKPSEILLVSLSDSLSQAPSPEQDVPRSLTLSSSLEQTHALQEDLKSSLADVLYMKREEIDPNQKFVEMGLDSIIGVEWVKAINHQLRTSISSTKVYDYPTIREFAEYIAGQMKQSGSSEAYAAATQKVIPPVTSVSAARPSLESAREISLNTGVSASALQAELTASLANILYMKPGEVQANMKFIEMGLDSILGVEWIKELNKQYGTSIMASKVYDYPTLAEFTLFLEEQIGKSSGTVSQQTQSQLVNEPVSRPEQLGNPVFQSRYRSQWSYYAGSMGRGVASESLVIAMGKAGLLSIFGSAGFKTQQIELHIQNIQAQLNAGEPYGVCLISNFQDPEEEQRQVELFLAYDVPVIEVSAFAGISESLVYCRIKGISRQQGRIRLPRRMIAKCSRLEVAQMFLSPPPRELVENLLSKGWINEEEARLSQSIPMADDLAVEADSGGHTDQGVAFSLIPSVNALKKHLQQEYAYEEEIMVGCGGGIGSPEAVASAFSLGADFVFTGSINQCTVESGAHEVIKDILQMVSIHDTAITIAGDMFEAGAKVQVVKKNSRYHARAQALFQWYTQYNSIDELPSHIKNEIETTVFKRTIAEVWEFVREYKNRRNPEELREAERNPRLKMALIFKWYFAHCGQITRDGDVSQADNFQIFCGPAMGACNAWLKGTPHEHWRNRHVHKLAEWLMVQASAFRPSTPPPAPVQQFEPSQTQGCKTRRDEDTAIAVIGMSGKFPMSANLAEFWENLASKKDCISEIPLSRWSTDDFYDPDPETPGKSVSKWMGMLEDVDLFDPLFFQITPVEAELMDPQQRLFLEHCWNSIEDAGLLPSSLSGSRCGVFVGCVAGDYGKRVSRQELNALGLMGETPSILAARISYLLNLKGPSMAIDTACSSSLVAIAEACDSLLMRNTDLALAGGVNVMEGPTLHIMTSKAGMLSGDGRCYTFDNRANGFVPGEGVGVVLLKRLSDAVRDQDQIHAVIRGWGVNQDGKTNGITAPSVKSQRELLQHEVYERFGIDPSTITLIEAHGTGTKLGDPIEVEALTEAFQAYSTDPNYCALGSVKSNIGHLLPAAGIAGALKVILALKQRQLPPTIHVEEVNEHLALRESPFYINTELQKWEPVAGVLRRAGISSFGFSGTNAHVVIEEYAGVGADRPGDVQTEPQTPVLVALSAKGEKQLVAYAESIHKFVQSHEQLDLADMAYTLQIGREAMSHRMAFMAGSRAEVLHTLGAFIRAEAIPAVAVGQLKMNPSGRGTDDLELERERQAQLKIMLKERNLRQLVERWVSGWEIDWSLLYDGSFPKRISLPTYPFAKRRYWVEPRQANTLTLSDPSAPLVTETAGPSQITLMPLNEALPGEKSAAVVTLAPLSSAAVPANPLPLGTVDSDLPEDTVLLEELTTCLAEALYLDSTDFEVDTKLVDMGVDSIVGVEWIRMINNKYGTSFPATIIYEHPTLRELARVVQKEKSQHDSLRPNLPVSTIGQQLFPSSAEAKAEIVTPSASTVPPSEEAEAPISNPPEFAVNALLEELAASLAEALYLEPSDMDVDARFVDIGMDSIVGVEWIRAVNKKYGTSFGAAMIYEYSCIREFGEFLLREFPAQISRNAPAPNLQNKEIASPAAPQSAYPATWETSSSDAYEEAIAIVGMSGTYPDAKDLDQFWDNLAQGKNSVREITEDRWDVNAYYDSRPFQEGKVNCKWLGMLNDIDCFDPLFFHISPGEAEAMDPQQRLFLQEAYKAFEHAGYSPRSLNNQQCSVYLGIMSNEYGKMASHSQVSIASTTGNSFAIAAARIPYFLNLKGAAIAIDTACSSSLVGIHLACQSLRQHETHIALVGGVTLYLTPEGYVDMCSAGMLSPDGKCKAFDNHANGFVPGEGVGALVLKRLKDAEADGDTIYGLIVGSGINQDGKTNGITAPNMSSQMELTRSIYEKYKIDPDTISYVEMHGTGTKLGDPIELEALSQVFKSHTARTNFCAIGSVKSNIGHTSAAAGIASVQKILLCMQHESLVPTLHFEQPNQHFNFAESPFYVNTERTAWKTEPHTPRRACVSSFGYSGTNAHLVLEEYKPKMSAKLESRREADVPSSMAVVLSAQSEEQLMSYANKLGAWIDSHPDYELGDLAYTLQTGRDALDYRLALVTESKQDTRRALAEFAAHRTGQGIYSAQVAKGRNGIVLLEHDADLRSHMPEWIKERNMHAIAQAWVSGFKVDWSQLVGSRRPRRIGLPTYPFAKERYWLPLKKTAFPARAEGIPQTVVLHPLLHQNVSILNEQRFRTVLTGEEFFLRDHRVNGERMLPGAAYLEMARAAIERSIEPEHAGQLSIRMQHFVWTNSIIVNDTPTELYIRVYASEPGEFGFDIYSLSEKIEGDRTIHGQGHGVLTAREDRPVWDLRALREQCQDRVWPAEQCYEAFRAMGIDYGPSHQVIVQIYSSPSQVLAKLELPIGDRDTLKQYILHPGVIDAAFQASLGLVSGSGLSELSLPYALDELTVYAACTPTMWAWVQYCEGSQVEGKLRKLNIELADESGRVCVRMIGLSVRRLQASPVGTPTKNKDLSVHMLHPSWHKMSIAEPAAAAEFKVRRVLVCSPDVPLLGTQITK